MLAVTQRTFGAPDVLEITEVARPEPIPSEVLVRIHAAAVNPVDAMIRSGNFPLLGDPPFILGWDVSGVVEVVVPGVTRFQRGDEVYGMPFFPAAPAPTPNTSPYRRGNWPADRSASTMCKPPRCRWSASRHGTASSTPQPCRRASGC
jgi:NADPH:quinone reductase-like Zn-dependent oxidoreductase